MRCPDCNKFVSHELNAEVNDTDVDEENVTTDIRMYLTCSECGGELAEYNESVETPVPQEALDHLEEHKDDREHHYLEVDNDDISTDERYDGKPGTAMRYRRHFYSATAGVTVRCACGEEWPVSAELESQASGFEQLY